MWTDTDSSLSSAHNLCETYFVIELRQLPIRKLYLPKWPDVAASTSLGIEMNYSGLFKEAEQYVPIEEEIMSHIFSNELCLGSYYSRLLDSKVVLLVFNWPLRA